MEMVKKKEASSKKKRRVLGKIKEKKTGEEKRHQEKLSKPS